MHWTDPDDAGHLSGRRTMINRRSLLASGAAFGAASTLGFPRGAMAAETVLITQAVTALAFIQNYVAKSQGLSLIHI